MRVRDEAMLSASETTLANSSPSFGDRNSGPFCTQQFEPRHERGIDVGADVGINVGAGVGVNVSDSPFVDSSRLLLLNRPVAPKVIMTTATTLKIDKMRMRAAHFLDIRFLFPSSSSGSTLCASTICSSTV
mmetsp:Transcript_39182/g.117803  ORF Transcript_39182/g.117803 Transcript_39182/m.117803 type:complete len:131 (+) Transcript_39182:2561-2953(+)